ncbi:MAG: amidohydrolase [Rhodobacteraceae bacterium]|nr:amidohydrolase [Paracoccaceae bacterium]
MIPPRPIRLAAAAYPVERLPDRSALAGKLADWAARAADADVLVFPEYAGMEAALAGGPATASVAEWCGHAAEAADWYVSTLRALAVRHGCYILAGSLPAQAPQGLVNRAFFLSPDGAVAHQDKHILTPWERRETPLCAGDGLHAFDTRLGRIGVLICYDCEFPLHARALGADILLVPSCTDLPAGDARVRAGARARALEGQAIAVHAPILGAVEGCELVDQNRGRAGIYAPPDHGFPADGVLARGAMDTSGWVFADLEAGAISAPRSRAAVNVPGHWNESATAAPPVSVTF